MLFFVGIAVALIVIVIIGAFINSARKKQKFNKTAAKSLEEYKSLVDSWVQQVEEVTSDRDLQYSE